MSVLVRHTVTTAVGVGRRRTRFGRAIIALCGVVSVLSLIHI